MQKNPPRDYVAEIGALIRRMPAGNTFVADEKLADEFFTLSEDPAVPDALRDFCIDLSIRARAIEVGTLGIADTDALLEKLDRIVATHKIL